jgi:undecaprenyl diphosphate synthase
MNTLEKIDKNNIPQHVAIIMDGNGRWAKKQGQERLYGHSIGVEAVRESINACLTLGVKYLTLYTFSTENWNRPKEEVDGIMNLLVQTISNELELLDSHQTGLIVIGDEDGLPDSCRDELREAKEFLAKNDKLYLVLALNYSSRWEIKNAIKNISNKVKVGELNSEDITDETISNALCTALIPDPELIIRTSGEHRISNFLLWQLAYSELYFTEVLWPDFKEDDLFKAVLNYQSRERRFGQTSEQII